jgi:DNA-binding CsgD family transcriptional regulator
VEPLTEREQEILHLLAVGYSNQAVAQELFMGVSTVKWHLINIYGKLQVKNRTQAVARAREVGLVQTHLSVGPDDRQRQVYLATEEGPNDKEENRHDHDSTVYGRLD